MLGCGLGLFPRSRSIAEGRNAMRPGGTDSVCVRARRGYISFVAHGDIGECVFAVVGRHHSETD